MRLIHIVDGMIPYGRTWGYLKTFVRVFLHMFGVFVAFAILFLFDLSPIAAALYYESVAHLFWYFISIPGTVVAIKFIAYHLRWDEVF